MPGRLWLCAVNCAHHSSTPILHIPDLLFWCVTIVWNDRKPSLTWAYHKNVGAQVRLASLLECSLGLQWYCVRRPSHARTSAPSLKAELLHICCGRWNGSFRRKFRKGFTDGTLGGSPLVNCLLGWLWIIGSYFWCAYHFINILEEQCQEILRWDRWNSLFSVRFL